VGCLESENINSDKRGDVCVVKDEAAFVRASSEVQAAVAKNAFSKPTVELSRCGYMIVTTSGGGKLKANFDALYAKIGSTGWEVAVAARSMTIGRQGKTLRNATMFDFRSRNGKSVSRSELEAMNGTLRRLAQSSVGRNSANVDIDRELESSASLDRAANRIRQGIGGAASALATASANGVPSAPASASTSKYQCTVTCTSSNGLGTEFGMAQSKDIRKIQISVDAESSYAADILVTENKTKICREANYFNLPGGAVTCR